MRKRHLISLLVAVVSIGVVSIIVMAVNNHSHHQALALTPVSPPASIASNCSSDATSALNAFFASLPANSVVNLPSNGCYLVSNSSESLLTVQNTNGLTINGNGTIFEQTSYDGNNDSQPILTLLANNSLTVNDLTTKGPASNSGDEQEGDAGIIMRQNNTVLLNAITITSVDGYGLDVYPLNNDPGVNWNVTVDNSTLENIGYHAIVPEAADGFTFENSTVTSGNVDAEVDFGCGPGFVGQCGTDANPAIGVQNMTFKNNSFPNGLQFLDGESCMPTDNWAIENNNFGTGGLNLQFNTTYSESSESLSFCAPDFSNYQSGLTITNNTSTDTTQPPCCGSGSPYFILQGWTNVTISGNHLVYEPSQTLPGQAFVDTCGDTNVAITNNDFEYMYNLLSSDISGGNSCGGAPVPAGSPNWPPSTISADCGNTYSGAPYTSAVQAACAGTKPPPPPTTPTGLKVTSNTANSVTLSWTASTDSGGPGLGGYYILKNGAIINYVNSSTLTYTDSSVTAGSTNSYTVEAFDNSTPTRIASEPSTSVTDTALKIVVVPPTVPTGVKAKANSATSVTVSWAASTDSGGLGLKGYLITRNGVTLNPYFPINTTSYTDNSAIAGQTYTYTVQAQDVSGTFSKVSASTTVTTPNPADTTPPTQPTKLTATAASASQINLFWTASTDNVGVANYTIWRSTGTSAATKIATVNTIGFGYGDTGLSASTKYNYYIVANDAAGNKSTPSSTVSATTDASTPTTVLAGIVTNASGTPLANVHVQTGINGSKAGIVSTKTNSAGIYVLANLTPSAIHVITYSLAGYKSVANSTDFKAGLFYLYTVKLTTASTILAGTVKDASGKPLANVLVSTGVNGTTTGKVSTYTNTSGGYILFNISPSKVHVFTYSLSGYQKVTYGADYAAGVFTHNVTLPN